MPPPPKEPDFFSAFQALSGQPNSPQGFNANSVPPNTGLGSRQSLLQNNRPAISNRNMVRWIVPDGPIIEMYLNPQNITEDDRKAIPSPARTKGGYIIQYWGPELKTLRIAGTTGTSGIEGINVLRDLYEAEQLAFDPYALALQAKIQQETVSTSIFDDSALSAGDQFVNYLINGSQASLPLQTTEYPSLAEIALGIEMYWSGVVYRGFFTSFSVRESADNLGLFDYDIGFTCTQKRGFRQNFLAWHRSPVHGPSNSNPITGTPYSFGPLIEKGKVPK